MHPKMLASSELGGFAPIYDREERMGSFGLFNRMKGSSRSYQI